MYYEDDFINKFMFFKVKYNLNTVKIINIFTRYVCVSNNYHNYRDNHNVYSFQSRNEL